MKWYEKLFRRPPKGGRWARTMNGYAPIYSQFGTNIYASDVVQQCLKCIADEMKKLNPQHVRYKGNDPVPIVDSSVQKVLDNPNPLMTTSEFLEVCTYLLLMNYNLFVIPTYEVWIDNTTGAERRKYESLYPIKPIQVDFIEDGSGRLYCKFFFANGYTTTIPYDSLIHIRFNFSVNQYMGGDEFGQPDHQALLNTLELNKKLLDGIARAMNASYAVNGLVKYGTIISKEDTERAISEFNEMLRKSESGFIPVDLKSEVVPFQRSTQIVDRDTLKFIDEKILRTWGIPLSILSGDYTTEQYAAFYQRCLEPLIKSFSQGFTKKIFSDRERSFWNKVEFYPEELIFLSVQQTIEMVNLLSPTGGMFENEKRVAFGLRPLPELEGKRYMSLNWIEAELAAQYQTKGLKDGNINVDVVDEAKQESISEV